MYGKQSSVKRYDVDKVIVTKMLIFSSGLVYIRPLENTSILVTITLSTSDLLKIPAF
jgi:hypothetical protein